MLFVRVRERKREYIIISHAHLVPEVNEEVVTWRLDANKYQVLTAFVEFLVPTNSFSLGF